MVAMLAAFSRTTFSSLKRRNFRLYFISQGISLTGGWMQSIAQSWLVLHLTGSAAALGVVAALTYGPSLFIGPYAGVLADRFPKRRLLAATQVALCLLALALGVAVLTDTVRAWMVFVMAGVLGVIMAVDYPTRQSFIYELAGPADLDSAVGLSGTVNNLARVVGPAIAGVLIASAGMAACFLLNAASYVVVIACLLLMRPAEFHRAHANEVDDERDGLMEGLRYAARTPGVREPLVMMAIIGVLTYEFSVTLPVFAKFALGASAAGLAYMMSAMGVGAAVGGLITAGRRGDGLGRLALTALGFGAVTALVGIAPNLMTATALMLLVGVFSARFVGLSNGLLQLRSEPEMRNRVMALWSTGFLGSTFIGGPVFGWLAQSVGPRWPLLVGALGGAIAAAVGWLGESRAREIALEPSTEQGVG